MSVKHPDVVVELVGEDGNAFSVIGVVNQAIRAEESPEAASEFVKEAMSAKSYDDLLSLIMRTVVVA